MDESLKKSVRGVVVIKVNGYEQISNSDRNANLYQKHEKVRAIQEKELTLIPYYAWANRGENEMQVWIRCER